MNLLRIQDALKNASDQQLMQLMQAPDSTAPSYLVLSEIRRRKDMRAQQAPQEGSSRTVAEDLTAPEDLGIRGMQMPERPPQDVSDQSGIEAMREGGVVRMEAGGRPPFVSATPPGDEFGATEYPFTTGGDDPIIFGRPLSSYSRDELERLMPGASRVLRSQGRGAAVGSAGAVRRFDEETGQTIVPGGGVVEQRLATLRARTEQPFPEEGAARLPELTALLPAEPTTTTQAQTQPPPPTATTPTDPQPQTDPNAERNRVLDALRSALPARPDENAERRAAARGEGRPAGAAGAAAAPAATEGGLPTMADIYRQNQGLFADGIGALRERAQQERVDPAARRSEAVNMALIEAGLRIAGSRNPSLVGAIGEGALPAVQSYGQQLGQIRAEQREARRDELELAKQELNRQFAVGQISATEFRTRMDNVNANLRAASAERAASIRAGASEAAADRRATAEADRVAAATERALEIENIRDRRARELATQQHEERELREISQGVQRAMTDLGTVSSTRTMLRAERLRQNPNERNPQISDDDVRNYMLDQAIRTRQEALRRARASGAGGAGTDAQTERPPLSSFQR